VALRILSISGLLPICELAASNSSFQLLTNFNYPHKTAEKLKKQGPSDRRCTETEKLDSSATSFAFQGFKRDWCDGRDNKYGSLAKEQSASLILLSSHSYFGGDADSPVIRKSCSSIADQLSALLS